MRWLYGQRFTYKMPQKGLIRTKEEATYVHILYDEKSMQRAFLDSIANKSVLLSNSINDNKVDLTAATD